ncbi:response regulator [Spirosoma pomorum]
MDSSLPIVFVADDDEDDRYLLRLCFTRHAPAYRLHFSVNGKELLADLAKQLVVPGLLLLDLNMPFMGGLEALERLRSTPRYATMPIVILTTSNNPDDKRKALALGATNFITKPISQPELAKIVVQLCNQWLDGKTND